MDMNQIQDAKMEFKKWESVTSFPHLTKQTYKQTWKNFCNGSLINPYNAEASFVQITKTQKFLKII